MHVKRFSISGADFFRQVQDFTRDFMDAPLLKLWIGPVPFVILFHADTVEVADISLFTAPCMDCIS